jgi:hypothetical protein
VRDGTRNRIPAREPDVAHIGKTQPQALGYGRGNRAVRRRETLIDLHDEIEKMLPMNLGGKYAVRRGRGDDDPIEILIVVFRIPQNSLVSGIEVRGAVEIRPRAPGDARADQRVAQKRASGPLRAADEIGQSGSHFDALLVLASAHGYSKPSKQSPPPRISNPIVKLMRAMSVFVVVCELVGMELVGFGFQIVPSPFAGPDLALTETEEVSTLVLRPRSCSRAATIAWTRLQLRLLARTNRWDQSGPGSTLQSESLSLGTE